MLQVYRACRVMRMNSGKLEERHASPLGSTDGRVASAERCGVLCCRAATGGGIVLWQVQPPAAGRAAR